MFGIAIFSNGVSSQGSALAFTATALRLLVDGWNPIANAIPNTEMSGICQDVEILACNSWFQTFFKGKNAQGSASSC